MVDWAWVLRERITWGRAGALYEGAAGGGAAGAVGGGGGGFQLLDGGPGGRGGVGGVGALPCDADRRIRLLCERGSARHRRAARVRSRGGCGGRREGGLEVTVPVEGRVPNAALRAKRLA